MDEQTSKILFLVSVTGNHASKQRIDFLRAYDDKGHLDWHIIRTVLTMCTNVLSTIGTIRLASEVKVAGSVRYHNIRFYRYMYY